MMKNTEWGAVAYLSHSKYGIRQEININNNSSCKTGYSALPSTKQHTYPGESGDGENYNQPYNTSIGYLASTTGNITGIYDMSGGNWEYMASKMANNFSNSEFNLESFEIYESKYSDNYSDNSNTATYQYGILGDATLEMGEFNNYKDNDGLAKWHNSWYGDYSLFLNSSYPWFRRGGQYSEGIIAGQFNFDRGNGSAHINFGSRLILSP